MNDRYSPIPVVVRLLAPLFGGALAIATCFASPAGGPLTGHELPSADDKRLGIESAAGILLGGDLHGHVSKATVDEDSPRRLVVHVTYDGFAGASLYGELLTPDRRRQSGITMGDPVTLADGGGDVTLTFEAQPGAQPTPSAFLRVNVAAAGRHTPGYTRWYRVGKEWDADAAAAAANVLVTPQPVGSTAQLGPTPTAVTPASSVRSAAPALTPPATGTKAIAMVAPAKTGTTTTRSITGGRASVLAGSRLDARVMTPVTPGSAPDATPRGPGSQRIRPFDVLRTEDIDLDLARVINVYVEVFQDQNPASGVYYFLPGRYALTWSATDGYGLRTTFSGAAAGQVLMSARVDGNIGPHDREIVANVVQAYARDHGQVFRELRALPADTLGISLTSQLTSFSIPADRISVQGFSDVLGRFDISWVSDERTKDFVHEALANSNGLQGSVTVVPPGTAVRVSVPVSIALGGDDTFGTFRWDRTGWKNETPYPIVLKYLHALRVPASGPPVVYSWSLGNTHVAPGGQVRWSAMAVPFWLDAQASKMWLDYSVDGSCRSCGLDALAALTGGVSGAGSSQIAFHSMTPLAETGAHDVVVEVRSRWFDPRGEELRTRTLVVDSDEKDFTVGPLFVDGGAGDANAMFEYRLALTMKDGNLVSGNAAWIPARSLRVPIGRHQLEQSIGALPGR